MIRIPEFIENDIPYVVAAAFKYIDGNVYTLAPPNRHACIERHIKSVLGENVPILGAKGFLLSNGEFANRKQAKSCAVFYSQLITDSKFPELYTEDLW